MKSCSYIIPYRKLDQYRENDLRCVIRYMQSTFPEIEIFIIEQDSEQRFINDMETKYLFTKNAGLFNRGWAFNVAAKFTDKKYLIFADGDIILKQNDFANIIQEKNKYSCIKPFNYRIHLSEDKSKQICNDLNLQDIRQEDIIGKAINDPFCAGVVIIERESFYKIGGWDERFEGWGGEDDAMTKKVEMILSHRRYYNECYHLFHPRSDPNDYINHKNYENNAKLAAQYMRMKPNILFPLIEEHKKTNGDIKKYDSR